MKKILMRILFVATLSVSVVSVQALTAVPQHSFVCGGGCTLRPHTRCPGGCFCDTSLGDGINTGICAVI